MAAFLLVGLLLGVFATVSAVAARKRVEDPWLEESWDRAWSSIDGPIDAGLYRLARPLGVTSAAKGAARNSALTGLRNKVTSSGFYGASLEVFLTVQCAAMLIGLCFLTVLVFAPMNVLFKVVCILFAIGIGGYPYNKVSQEVKKKEAAVDESLPDFVDLLHIPVAAGVGLLDSLRFTARFTDSVVSAEVRWLLDTLAARTMSEAEAFRAAGARLGTPEAAAFFSTVGQSYIKGGEIRDALAKQSDSLRVKAYQRRRMVMKRLPVKFIVTFAIHFLPLLMVMGMIPLFFALSNI